MRLHLLLAGVLFVKIEDTQVTEWSERFGGADA